MTVLVLILTFFYIAGLIWMNQSIIKHINTPGILKAQSNLAFESSISGVSIVVPFRNESQNLPDLLNSLGAQIYSESQLEFILVDDHSEEEISSIRQEYANNKFRWLNLDVSLKGKKSALDYAIQQASFEIILTTDADCQHHEYWIETMVQPFKNPSTQMVIGAVAIDTGSMFARLQQLEFSAVIVTGMLLASQGRPVYCNGANLAFRKSAFHKVGGYAGNYHLASGDDVFLLQKIDQVFINGIEVVWSKEAQVKTKAVLNFKKFLAQRIRWAGKLWHTKPQSGLWFGAGVLFFQLISVYGWISIISSHTWIGLLILLPKWLAEVWLLNRLSHLFSFKSNFLERFLLVVLYPIYVAMVAISSGLFKPFWKGRPTLNYGIF